MAVSLQPLARGAGAACLQHYRLIFIAKGQCELLTSALKGVPHRVFLSKTGKHWHRKAAFGGEGEPCWSPCEQHVGDAIAASIAGTCLLSFLQNLLSLDGQYDGQYKEW